MRYLLLLVLAGMFVPALPGCQSSDTERAEEAKVPSSTQPYINDVSGRQIQSRTQDTGSVLH